MEDSVSFTDRFASDKVQCRHGLVNSVGFLHFGTLISELGKEPDAEPGRIVSLQLIMFGLLFVQTGPRTATISSSRTEMRWNNVAGNDGNKATAPRARGRFRRQLETAVRCRHPLSDWLQTGFMWKADRHGCSSINLAAHRGGPAVKICD